MNYLRVFVFLLAKLSHEMTGIDLTEEMIREAKETAALRPCQQPRPEWDVELLKDAGFHKIRVDTGVWERIYHDKDEFYNPTPVFAITAKA